MKKVLLLLLVSLAFVSCDKSGISKDGEILESRVPYYYSWESETVKIKDKDNLCHAFFTSDSVIVEYKRWNDVLGEYLVDVYKHSTHNNVFADVDPSRMNDEQWEQFARDFAKELRRETDRKAWIETLDLLYLCDSPTAYGLLWGLCPTSYSASTPGVFWEYYTLQFYFKLNDFLSYRLEYEINISSDTESVSVTKFEDDERHHTESSVVTKITL